MAVERRRTQLGLSNPGVGEINVGVSKGGSFAQGLIDAASAATNIGAGVAQNFIEDDKVTQANRAVRGLLPSEDATGGGTRAHMLVSTQNSLNDMTARLKDDAARWDGTNEEWDQHVNQKRAGLEQSIYDQYPELRGDRTTSKLVTNMMVEQAPNIQMSKIASDLQREQVGRQQTFTTRMTQVTANLDGPQITAALNGDLRTTAKALQMTDAEFEEAVANEAKSRASTGDTRMLMATQGIKNSEGVSLYDRDASVRSATIAGLRTHTALNQTELADDRYGLETRFLSGEMSDSEFISAASIMNTRTGGSAYSAEAINSLRDQKAKASAKTGKTIGFINGVNSGSLVALEDYSEKEINEGQKAYHAQADAAVDAYIATKGLDSESGEALRAKTQSEVTVNLAKAGVKDTTMVRQINSFMNIGPDHLAKMESEPDEMKILLNRWNTLPDYMRNQIVGDKEAAFVDNYQKGLSNNMNPGQALDFAQKASRTINFSGKENKDINDGGSSVAGDIISKSGFNPFDNYPDYIRQQMITTATDDVRTFRKAGYDMDAAKEQASLNLSNNYSYEGGTVIKGDRRRLAQKMQINEKDIGAQFQAYLQVNKSQLEDAAGGPGIDEMYFDIDQKRGIYTVRAGSSGIPVQSAKPLSELGDYKWLDQVNKLKESDQKQMNERLIRAQGFQFGNSSSMADPDAQRPEGMLNGLMESLFPKAQAGERTPDFGEVRKNNDFEAYLQSSENTQRAGFDPRAGVFSPYDSDEGTAGADTVAYGHLLTSEEKKNGYITIGGQPVPYRPGESQLTEGLAKALLQQDVKAHTPETPGWKVGIDEVPGNIRRALIDTSFNMGKSFLKNNPSANAWFKQGDYNAGFIQLLTASNEGGKRNKGVLVRRASAYNMANPGDWPKIDKVEMSEDGGMAVKFTGNMDAVNPRMRSLIGDDGWMLVKHNKEGSKHVRSKAGIVDL